MCIFCKRKENISFNLIEEGYSLTGELTVGNNKYRNAMKCVLDTENRELLICDIYVEKNGKYIKFINKGYGTLMMSELIKFAKENGYTKIFGNFGIADANSSEDPTHRERQIHFYKKFGFEILPNEGSPKTMELNL